MMELKRKILRPRDLPVAPGSQNKMERDPRSEEEAGLIGKFSFFETGLVKSPQKKIPGTALGRLGGDHALPGDDLGHLNMRSFPRLGSPQGIGHRNPHSHRLPLSQSPDGLGQDLRGEKGAGSIVDKGPEELREAIEKKTHSPIDGVLATSPSHEDIEAARGDPVGIGRRKVPFDLVGIGRRHPDGDGPHLGAVQKGKKSLAVDGEAIDLEELLGNRGSHAKPLPTRRQNDADPYHEDPSLEGVPSSCSRIRPKIILPAEVCRTLVTTTSTFFPMSRRLLSTTIMVPSSR